MKTGDNSKTLIKNKKEKERKKKVENSFEDLETDMQFFFQKT